MKAMVLREYNQPVRREEVAPQIEPGEVLILVRGCGVQGVCSRRPRLRVHIYEVRRVSLLPHGRTEQLHKHPADRDGSERCLCGVY